MCGRSGSRKLTLIGCINTLEEQLAGEVVVEGIVLPSELKNINMSRADVGMCFHHFNASQTLLFLKIACALAQI
ncbi:hypothetical protein ABVF61_30260 [Roseibium sp. HPY-6]|uniref:hypothetical protein n=1 Tax=Roseibium sp. HPY-6 TaxID=3229852 RepID=UPI00338EB858